MLIPVCILLHNILILNIFSHPEHFFQHTVRFYNMYTMQLCKKRRLRWFIIPGVIQKRLFSFWIWFSSVSSTCCLKDFFGHSCLWRAHLGSKSTVHPDFCVAAFWQSSFSRFTVLQKQPNCFELKCCFSWRCRVYTFQYKNEKIIFLHSIFHVKVLKVSPKPHTILCLKHYPVTFFFFFLE